MEYERQEENIETFEGKIDIKGSVELLEQLLGIELNKEIRTENQLYEFLSNIEDHIEDNEVIEKVKKLNELVDFFRGDVYEA